MNELDISKYTDIAQRRKWWIIIPFLLTLLAGLSYALIAPKVYEAETLILVIPQKVPQSYVRSIVSVSMEDRLRTITQQVTSRTNLEKIIKQFSLFSGDKDAKLLMDDKVELLRKRIRTSVIKGGRTGGGAFKIRFEDEDPERVAQVTNTLASNFIAENLKIRESQALGTSQFLNDELQSVKRKLADKEEELKRYRTKYMGGLPEQLQTNLSILARLQAQVDQYNENLRDAENRKILLQQQIADGTRAASEGERILSVRATPKKVDELAAMKDKLAMLESRYTENHPDVIRLRETIKRLEQSRKATKAPEEAASPEPRSAVPTVDVNRTLRRQLEEVDLEINRLKQEIRQTQGQIKVYQKRIEDTPRREQEVLALNRDYGNLKGLYNSLLNRKLEAELAVSMEKKQKGEQFKILDPAKIPERPIKPDMRKIMLATLAVGLLLGCALAYLVEMRDTSYKHPKDVEEDLSIPVLLSLPITYTERELRVIKAKKYLAYSSVTLGFLGSVFGVLVATKGLDKTLRFFTEFVSRIGG